MKKITDKAEEIVFGDREQTYGNPSKNLDMIAGLWSAYTGVALNAHDVCHMMMLLKIVRLKNNTLHEDTMIDVIGYTLLKERINESS